MMRPANKTFHLLGFSAAAVLTLCLSCSTIAQIGSSIGVSTGVITEDQGASINKVAVAVEKTLEDITPEQEYYIGRSVGANVLTIARPYKNAEAGRYINLLGQSLAFFSTKPETFGGYHFMILDSDEINAFAAPGGLIFVTRGMLRCCNNEHELAAVLAHEIAHVQYQHGLKAIKTDRLTSALAIIGTEAAKTLGPAELKDLTTQFEGSITDITKTMVNSGYSRDTEVEADKGAVAILQKSGFNPSALVLLLGNMKTRLKPGAPDFAKTHPDPDYRMGLVRKAIGTAVPVVESPAAQERRLRSLAGI